MKFNLILRLLVNRTEQAFTIDALHSEKYEDIIKAHQELAGCSFKVEQMRFDANLQFLCKSNV